MHMLFPLHCMYSGTSHNGLSHELTTSL